MAIEKALLTFVLIETSIFSANFPANPRVFVPVRKTLAEASSQCHEMGTTDVSFFVGIIQCEAP